MGLRVVVGNWLLQAAALSPNAPAVISESGALSYSGLVRRAGIAVRELEARGVGPLDRVPVAAERSESFAVLLHALMGIGAVLVPVDVRSPRVERDLALSLCGADGADVLRPGELDTGEGEPAALRASFGGGEPQCVILTSGSSGMPRAVELTYSNHLWSAVGGALRLGHRAGDVWLSALPTNHIAGLAVLLRSAVVGGSAGLMDGFDVARFGAAAADWECGFASLVPTMVDRLVAGGAASQLSGLGAALVGGGPVSAGLVRRCVEAGVPVAPTYGLTECASQVATATPAEARERPGSVGRPIAGARLRTASDGQILVAGPMISPSVVEPSGWLRTADRGRLDADGYLFVEGRRDAVIVTGARNVSPEEVEGAMLEHPHVLEVAVFGRPHEEWQWAVTAQVVLDSAVTAAEAIDSLGRHLAGRLAAYKIPKAIEPVSSLPRTAMGKLRRGELR